VSVFRILFAIVAIAAIILSITNASWVAPKPQGRLLLIAHRGAAQQYPHSGDDDDTCTAARIRPPEHKFIENTIFSMENARRLGANVLELDVQPTVDRRVVAFADRTLDCRTNGTGLVGEHSLAALKKLDLGYGYTADGGRTYPLRGRGIGAIPTVEEVLTRLRGTPLLFDFKTRHPDDADLLFAAFERAGVPIDANFGFYGDPTVTRRMQQLAPRAWTFNEKQVRGCLAAYLKTGWTGQVPESCRNGTIAVPLNYQWMVWGWPNRFLDRMAKANTRVVLLGNYDGGAATGITQPEQLAEIPRDFRGYLWVEDIYNVGPSLQR
jgi:glycerophosphoryl diester phosphodiesterase